MIEQPLQLTKSAAPAGEVSAQNPFQLTLDAKYARGLEEFTTQHARVVVLIDGSAVTKHKREPIRKPTSERSTAKAIRRVA